MISINGIFDGTKIIPIEKIPIGKRAKVIITFVEEQEDREAQDVRDFTEGHESFDFWNDEREDIYQDYLKK